MIFSTVEADRQRLLSYCKQLKNKTLHLDLSEVEQCDSAGLAFLIEVMRIAKLNKLIYEIGGISQTVEALAEFCGVSKILGVKKI